MGLEYYLINRKTRTFYELGKGGWYCLKEDMEYVFDIDLLRLVLVEDVFDLEEREKDPDYSYIADSIAPAIFQFVQGATCQDLQIVNDCGDDLYIMRCLGYRCMGSRYTNPHGCVDFLNRHFDPKYQGQYKSEDAKNYSGFDWYAGLSA